MHLLLAHGDHLEKPSLLAWLYKAFCTTCLSQIIMIIQYICLTCPRSVTLLVITGSTGNHTCSNCHRVEAQWSTSRGLEPSTIQDGCHGWVWGVGSKICQCPGPAPLRRPMLGLTLWCQILNFNHFFKKGSHISILHWASQMMDSSCLGSSKGCLQSDPKALAKPRQSPCSLDLWCQSSLYFFCDT